MSLADRLRGYSKNGLTRVLRSVILLSRFYKYTSRQLAIPMKTMLPNIAEITIPIYGVIIIRSPRGGPSA